MMADTLSLFVFIDALGWELLRNNPFLDDVATIKAPLRTVFGYSATCDPTIITGLAPREHGHFSFYVYDPVHSPFKALGPLAVLPRGITNRGRVRHWISRLVKASLGYTGYFQLYAMPFDHARFFDYTEKRDIYREGGIIGGQPSVFVLLDRAGIPYFLSDWRRGDAQALADAGTALASGRPRLAYVYLAAMDAVLHADGKASTRAQAMIRDYDAAIRTLLAVAGQRYDQVRLFVFSDHGMTDIHSICPLMELVERTGWRFGTDYAAVYDSTMARFWFMNDAARSDIVAALGTEPRGRILDDTTLSAWGIDFPDKRYGELFFVLDPGVLLCPSHMGVKPLAGMHGFDPGHADSTAAFVSSVPLEQPPVGLADLFGLMCREAGL
jgi:predicted AlkP superfamily pyrophosphatase or phosphodiesterase